MWTVIIVVVGVVALLVVLDVLGIASFIHSTTKNK